MSTSTLTPMPGGFDDFEAIVAGLNLETQPLGEPLPEPEQTRRIPLRRPARGDKKREAIDAELGLRRHRTREREA